MHSESIIHNEAFPVQSIHRVFINFLFDRRWNGLLMKIFIWKGNPSLYDKYHAIRVSMYTENSWSNILQPKRNETHERSLNFHFATLIWLNLSPFKYVSYEKRKYLIWYFFYMQLYVVHTIVVLPKRFNKSRCYRGVQCSGTWLNIQIVFQNEILVWK